MLKRSRWLLLKRPEKLTGEQRGRLAELVRRNLRTVRAYLLKEDFQSLWGYVSPYWATASRGRRRAGHSSLVDRSLSTTVQ